MLFITCKFDNTNVNSLRKRLFSFWHLLRSKYRYQTSFAWFQMKCKKKKEKKKNHFLHQSQNTFLLDVDLDQHFIYSIINKYIIYLSFQTVYYRDINFLSYKKTCNSTVWNICISSVKSNLLSECHFKFIYVARPA